MARVIAQAAAQIGGAMNRKLTVKITTTRRRKLSLAQTVIRVRCPVCGREVEMLDAAQAAAVLEADAETLSQLVAEGRVHTIESVSGSLRICKDPLFTRQRQRG
jgi:hypothetical protein